MDPAVMDLLATIPLCQVCEHNSSVCRCTSWCPRRCPVSDFTYLSNRPPSVASSYGSTASGVSHPPKAGGGRRSRRKKVVNMSYTEFANQDISKPTEQNSSYVESWRSSIPIDDPPDQNTMKYWQIQNPVQHSRTFHPQHFAPTATAPSPPVLCSDGSRSEAPVKPHHNGLAGVKPRLTKEQHDILEAHFQQQHKPSNSTKKGFAEGLGVPLEKINNWFQNRRAKAKQDIKKQINQSNTIMDAYRPTQILHEYEFSRAPASDHVLRFGGPNEDQAFSQADLYQHSNASVQAVLSSPGQGDGRKLSTGSSDFDNFPVFSDDAFTRRNSSISKLANSIEEIHIQNSPLDGFKRPNQPSNNIERHRKRPTALNPSALRNNSYTGGIPFPGGNSDHSLRRIRSSGIPNATNRAQKANPGSVKCSPMNLTFADGAASPKFARTFSLSDVVAVEQGGSLAPPTPLTPNEMGGRFPSWQNNIVFSNYPATPEHSSPESFHANWSVEPQSAGLFSNTASTPSTHLDPNS